MQFQLFTIAAFATLSMAVALPRVAPAPCPVRSFTATLEAGETRCLDSGAEEGGWLVTCKQTGPGPKLITAEERAQGGEILLSSTSTGTVTFTSVDDGAVGVCVKNTGTKTITAGVSCA